jgi:hypothetical protein
MYREPARISLAELAMSTHGSRGSRHGPPGRRPRRRSARSSQAESVFERRIPRVTLACSSGVGSIRRLTRWDAEHRMAGQTWNAGLDTYCK